MPHPPQGDQPHPPQGDPNTHIQTDVVDCLRLAFLEERVSLNTFLEEKHARLISQLRGELSNGAITNASKLLPEAYSTSQNKYLQLQKLNGVYESMDAEFRPADSKEPQVLKKSKSVTLSVEVEDDNKSDESLKAEGRSISEVQVSSSKPSLFNKEGTLSFDRGYSIVDRDMAIRRLQARMGYMAPGFRVTPELVHQALQTLSLVDIDYEDILHFITKVREVTERDLDEKPSMPVQRKKTSTSMLESIGSRVPTIPFSVLVDVLTSTTDTLIPEYGEFMAEKIMEYKDILLQSDANCVVAELMCLRVDDISAPVEPATFLELIEPFVGAVIMLNGVLIGFQTDTRFSSSDAMLYIEMAFTLFFCMELFLKVHINGIRDYFFGEDRYWNWFDFCVVCLAIMDVIVSILPSSDDVDTNTLTIFRLARLTRLTRLVRIFRLQFLEELTLMVKGLLGGLRTLLWAVVLLFFILYIIGIFLTLMVGADVGANRSTTPPSWNHEREVHFSTLPKSMFTTFRCLLVVDCVSTQGTPLLTEMTSEYGWTVPVGYTFCFVVVSIGLMNLIMAIYIENTLNNAKQADDRSKIARSRESFRVARQLKKLLVMFTSAQKFHHRQSGHSLGSFSQELVNLIDQIPHDQDVNDLSLQISRETFMLCLQHPMVQRILDDLDIPPERAHLFDQLDADSSGHLLPTELVNGLLKVRGETRRGDVVANLLAIRSLQQQVRQIQVMLAQSTRTSAMSRTVSNTQNGVANGKKLTDSTSS